MAANSRRVEKRFAVNNEFVPNVRRGLERDKMLFEVSYLALEVCNNNLLKAMDSTVTSVILELFSTNKPGKKSQSEYFYRTFFSNLFTLYGDRMSTEEFTYRIIQLPIRTIFNIYKFFGLTHC